MLLQIWLHQPWIQAAAATEMMLVFLLVGFPFVQNGSCTKAEGSALMHWQDLTVLTLRHFQVSFLNRSKERTELTPRRLSPGGASEAQKI